MRAIETNAVVTRSGTLTAQVPPDIPPGEHRIVLVIDEQPVIRTTEAGVDFPLIQIDSWPKNFSLRREDLYDERGR